jgi:hypothetical protein
MWIRAGFFALVLAGSVLGGVEAVSAPSGLIACGSGSYENSDGQCIPDPSQGGGGAAGGATAVCRDGDYSYSTHHSGTCSGHGGVSQWLTS